MLKKLTTYYLKKIFPDERCQYLSHGTKSAAFRTELGKIVRVKPIWFGTYNREARILNFINSNCGIGCNIPNIKTFNSFPFAFSVHRDLGGKTADNNLFNNLDSVTQESFAKQLTKTLINLRGIGVKLGAEKKFKKSKPVLFRQIKYIFFLLNKKELLVNWLKLHRAYLKIITRSKDRNLSHNDLHLKNVIVDNNFNLVGLIDFGDIQFFPLEYNLRKVTKVLCNLMVKNWNEEGYEIDTVLLSYYRAEFLLSRLVKRKKNKEALLCELKETLIFL